MLHSPSIGFQWSASHKARRKFRRGTLYEIILGYTFSIAITHLYYLFSKFSFLAICLASFCKGRRPVYIEEEGEFRIPIIMERSPIFKECSMGGKNHYLKEQIYGLSSLTTSCDSSLMWLKETSTSNLLKNIPKKSGVGTTKRQSARWCRF